MTNELLQTTTALRAALSGRSQSISAQILRGASSTAVLKVVSTGLTFVTAIVLARFLGVEEYGTYAYAMSWVLLLGVFAGLGLNQVIIADVAVYHQNDDWAHIRGMLRFAITAVTAASILCALAVAGIGWLMHRDEPLLYTALLLACLLLPIRALLLPLGATQNGLRQVIYAQIPTLLVVPAGFLAMLAAAFGLGLLDPSARAAVALQLLALMAGLAVAALLLQRGLAAAKRPQALPTAQYKPRVWMLRALPLMFLGSMFLVNSNADILMLGALVGSEAAGLYKAASRGAELVAFSLMAVNVPLGPAMARLHASGDMPKLQQTLTRWARLAFGPAAALAISFVVWGDWFLGLFGPDIATQQSYESLMILCAAQLINVAAGSVGLLLIMTKKEKLAALGVSIAALLNVLLNALLIPSYGLQGAAVATAASTIGWNLVLVYFVFRELHINPTIIAFRFRSAQG